MKETVTLMLDGHIPPHEFGVAMVGYTGLLNALTTDLKVKGDVDWSLDGLIGVEERAEEAGITFRGEASDPEKVARVVSAYEAVGAALESGRPIGYSAAVVRHAHRITSVLNGKITVVRFQTSERDATVYSDSVAKARTPPLRAYGAVTGRVQTLTNRQGLRFTLYDALYDRAVSCYLEEGRDELMRGMWGKMAIVEGWISRDAMTGRPIAIRQVSNVTLRLEVEPGSFKNARGSMRPPAGAELPEVTIRRLRDA